MPLIDVLIPVRNGAAFLPETLDSLAHQTLADFRVLVCDDGSTDATPAILAAERRFPVLVTRHERSRGISASLNALIALSLSAPAATAARFLARLDADDLCRADRFEQQVRFLEAHPDIGIVGSWFLEIDPRGQVVGERRLPVDPAAIRFELLFSDPLSHPALLLRHEVFAGSDERYDSGFDNAEDYRLWCLLAHRVRFANIPEPLISYRRHPGAVGIERRRQQTEMMDRVRRDYLESFRFGPGSHALLLHLLHLAVASAAPSAADSLRLLRELDAKFPPAASPHIAARRDELSLGLLALLPGAGKLPLLLRDGRTRRAYRARKMAQWFG